MHLHLEIEDMHLIKTFLTYWMEHGIVHLKYIKIIVYIYFYRLNENIFYTYTCYIIIRTKIYTDDITLHNIKNN